MAIELPPLPYARDALAPHISAETLDYHYGKHHQGYVTKVNEAIAGTDMEHMSLEDIIRKATGGLFNSAAQTWNHTLYWNSLSPSGGGDPSGKLADGITRAFGSVEEFRKQFSAQAGANFGSGWTWLVQRPDGSLAIVNTSNAGTPLPGSDRALLTCDVWEHAYYIDYRNARPAYLDAFWNLVNWDFAADNMA